MRRRWRLVAYLSPPTEAVGASGHCGGAIVRCPEATEVVQHAYHFYTEDHPDRTTAVGCLPLLVSPTIRNLKVNKMLVDGGAGLNLISPVVIERL